MGAHPQGDGHSPRIALRHTGDASCIGDAPDHVLERRLDFRMRAGGRHVRIAIRCRLRPMVEVIRVPELIECESDHPVAEMVFSLLRVPRYFDGAAALNAKSSKTVTLSALVHIPTAPAPEMRLSCTSM